MDQSPELLRRGAIFKSDRIATEGRGHQGDLCSADINN